MYSILSCDALSFHHMVLMITAQKYFDSKTLAGWLLYTANQLEQTLQIKLWQNDHEPPNPTIFYCQRFVLYSKHTIILCKVNYMLSKMLVAMDIPYSIKF